MKASLLLLLGLATAAGASAEDPIRVVCTIPDLADFARRIGGERVDVVSIAKGTQNIHLVPIKPSHLVAMNRADLFVEMGLSLEHAYVPGLLERSRNPSIQPGEPGFLNCSEGWTPREVPESASRGQAVDVHPFGNPHFNLDPRAGEHLADRILEGLVRVDPAGGEVYRERHATLLVELKRAQERWAAYADVFAGRKIVTYHRDFSYLAAHYGIEVVATIEPKPGLPPSPRDLARIVQRMKAEDVGVVMTAKWSNNKSVRFLAEKTGATVVEAPIMVGGARRADSWIAMMDVLHASLAEALEGS